MLTNNDTSIMMDNIENIIVQAVENTNIFCSEKILTRGGRVGSGMGTLLESLWGFNMNQILLNDYDTDYEIAWFPDNDYNDFACVKKNVRWEPQSHRGELFKIEIKSMNLGADESKGHFDEIQSNIGKDDLLIVLIWSWRSDDDIHVYPYIDDYFVGNARKVANLRDKLHIARGGTFVDSATCPDNCLLNNVTCTHNGEPLNASGNRERLSGPISTKPSGSSHASNFGGLVRMLKTSNDDMRHIFRTLRSNCDVAHKYITFIHKNFPAEEFNQYTTDEWKLVAKKLSINTNKNKSQLVQEIRNTHPNYREFLKSLY